jgi:hypothetical protein
MKNILRLALSASMALAALAAQAETYVLMIGIADYPDVVDASGQPVKDKDGNLVTNDLSGCVNDIKSYETVLTSKYGVKKENVKVILDKEANETGFVNGVKWLLGAAKPGDQVMFFYSGHGTQYESKAEEDGTQEAIVLADMTLVDGDLFNKVAQALSKAGMNASFVFDSCYSGGMSRDELTKSFQGKDAVVRKRYLTAADLKAMPKSKEFPSAKELELTSIPRKKAAAQGGSYAFVMAGNDKQTTADLQFKDPNKPSHGLFSLVFLEVLEKMPDVGIEVAVKAIEKIILDAKFDQNPTTEFSSATRGSQPFFLKG